MTHRQNVSHAVMAQRFEPSDSLDDFPTPPWASRALIEHVIGRSEAAGRVCLEPACGRGYMSQALEPYFSKVMASDIAEYGHGSLRNFLTSSYPEEVDWVITNPPFRHAEDFFHKGFDIAREGVALLVRTVFLEGKGRLERTFSQYPPTVVAQFSERVPMVKGRLDKKASTATGYAWFVWRKPLVDQTRLVWIPPCRKLFERDDDYKAAGEAAPKPRLGEAPSMLDMFHDS